MRIHRAIICNNNIDGMYRDGEIFYPSCALSRNHVVVSCCSYSPNSFCCKARGSRDLGRGGRRMMAEFLVGGFAPGDLPQTCPTLAPPLAPIIIKFWALDSMNILYIYILYIYIHILTL